MRKTRIYTYMHMWRMQRSKLEKKKCIQRDAENQCNDANVVARQFHGYNDYCNCCLRAMHIQIITIYTKIKRKKIQKI